MFWSRNIRGVSSPASRSWPRWRWRPVNRRPRPGASRSAAV